MECSNALSDGQSCLIKNNKTPWQNFAETCDKANTEEYKLVFWKLNMEVSGFNCEDFAVNFWKNGHLLAECAKGDDLFLRLVAFRMVPNIADYLKIKSIFKT